ncbi:MAG: hypothetical protein ACFFD1_08390, partial [Candidatus Thorarchaeota archaeon]
MKISQIKIGLNIKITLWIFLFLISYFAICPTNSLNFNKDDYEQDGREMIGQSTSHEYFSSFTKWGGSCQVQANSECSGQFFYPKSITVNNSGILFITDSGNNRIQLFDKYGNLISIWNDIGLNQPTGITVNSSGYVFVGDSGNHRISVLSPDGSYIKSWGFEILGGNLPDLVILKNGDLAISDLDNKRILIFNQNGEVKNTIGASMELRNLAINPVTGNIFATELITNKSREFSQNGNIIFSFGTSGLNIGELSDPTGLSFDSNYNLIIANQNNDRIQFFDVSGNYLFGLTGLESGSEIFESIQDITYYDNNLYVIESGNHQWIKVLKKVVYTEPDYTSPILNPSIISFGLDHTAKVFTTSFSPDGMNIISGDVDGNIKIRSLVNNLIIKELKDNNSPIFTLKYSPNGSYVASGGADTKIKIWNLLDSTIVTTLVGHKGAINSISYSPDGRKLLSGGADGQAMLWDIKTESIIKEFTDHTSVVSAVAFSHSGSLIATGSWDKSVKLWETTNYNLIRSISIDTNKSEITSLCFSPNDQTLIFGDFNGNIGIVDVSNLTAQFKVINAHYDKVLSVDFHPDNLHFVSGGKDGRVLIHDLKNSSNTYQIANLADCVSSTAFSSDESSLVSGNYNHKVYLFNINFNRSIDSDNDGMIDIFEKLNGLNPYNYNDKYLDSDGDGLSNIMEYKYWSNPNSNDTDLDGLPDEIEIRKSLKITFNDAQCDYDLDGLPNLWEFEYGFDISMNDSFLDFDNDNLTNIQEYMFRSNPLQVDTDRDGMDDGEEFNAVT